jgi:hypothetical protein
MNSWLWCNKMLLLLLPATVETVHVMVLQAIGRDCLLGGQQRTAGAAPCNCCDGLICCECQLQ